MTRFALTPVNLLVTLGFRIASLVVPIHREPQDEYKIHLFISTVRKGMSFLFGDIADKLSAITLGEEAAPGDMVLDIDERLISGPHPLYVCADKLLRSERFSHFFSERALDRFIIACSLQKNKATHPQVYVECDTPFTGSMPGITENGDPFARYFRKAISGRPHIIAVRLSRQA